MLLSGITAPIFWTAEPQSPGFQEMLNQLWTIPLWIIGGILALAVLIAGFLWLCAAVVNTKKNQEHDSKFYRGVVSFYAGLLMVITRTRVHTKGLEQVPKKGRFLLVCNHLSEADPVILLHFFRKHQLAFITKRENTTRFIIGPVMHKIMCQPVNRENDREALKTILNCVHLLEEDEVSIGVFPEGYIRGDGLLHRFRSGVFKIAQKTKVPIVVCTLKNPAQIFVNLPKLKPTQVSLNLIKTIQPEEYEGMKTTEIADMIYRMMAEDLGSELVAQEETS